MIKAINFIIFLFIAWRIATDFPIDNHTVDLTPFLGLVVIILFVSFLKQMS